MFIIHPTINITFSVDFSRIILNSHRIIRCDFLLLVYIGQLEGYEVYALALPELGVVFYLCVIGACKASVSDFSQLYLEK